MYAHFRDIATCFLQEYYRGVLVSERVPGNNEEHGEWMLNSMTNIMLRIIIAYLHIVSVTPMIILTLQLQLLILSCMYTVTVLELTINIRIIPLPILQYNKE